MNTDHDHDYLDPKLAERFIKMRDIPARNTQRASDGRAAFLLHARELAQIKPQQAPVSHQPRERLILWMHTITDALQIKETRQMFTKLMAVVIAAVLVFSGVAATAYASQGSLPNDALYGVKTFGENVRLSLAPQADDKLGLALEFAQRRVDEIAALNELGIQIPEHVATQYHEQVEYTLRLAGGLSDNQIGPALERVRTHLQEQLQKLEQLHQSNPDDPALIQARDRLREQLRLVEDGLADPQQFRQQIRLREQQGPSPLETEQPGPSVTQPAGNQNSNTNSSGNANGNMNANSNENANGNNNTNDDSANGNGNDDGGNFNGNDDGGNGNGNDDGGIGNGNDDDGNYNGGNDGNGNDDGGGGNHNGDNDNGGGGNDDGGGGNDNGGGGGGNDNGGGGNDDSGGGSGNGNG